MKRIFTIFLTLFVASSAWAYDFEVDGIYYDNFGDGTVGVTSRSGEFLIDLIHITGINGYQQLQRDEWLFYECNDYVGDVTIPSEVTYRGDTYSVVEISPSAFWGCKGLTSITIPETVTYISPGAFVGCTNLKSVTIPNGVSDIWGMTFAGCSNLESVVIPESVSYIGIAFGTDQDGNLIKTESSSPFYECSSLTSITIPESITSIEEYAFRRCTGLTSITIPESVTSIDKSAFSGCTGLTSITIPRSVTSIDENAFSKTLTLTYLSCPNGFYGSQNSLEWYILHDGIKYRVKGDNIVSVAANSYTGDIVIPSTISAGNTFTVTSIDDDAFTDCTGLTSVVLPESVSYIPTNSFKGCTGLTSLTSFTFNYDAFADCKQLKSITYLADRRFWCKNDIWNSYDHRYSDFYLYVPCQYKEKYYTEDLIGDVITEEMGMDDENYNWITWVYYIHVICVSYDVTLSASNNAQGSVEGDGEFLLGETVTITAKPASGYKFEQWSDGSTENPRTITVNSDVNYTAIFVEIPVYSVELGVNNASYGSVKGDGEFEEGATTSISATAYSGYRFTQWNDGNTENPRKLTVNTDMSFTAMFEEIPVYAIFVAANDASYGSVEGSGEYKEGSTASISATAYPGYKFTQWNDGNTANPRNVTISADQNFTAIFEKLSNPTAVSEVSNTTAVTVVNGQILVNGEAPAFVVTVSGQKIANANLKTGVYFVVMDGKTIGVSVW